MGRPRWFSPGADDSVRLNLTESLTFIMEQISNFAPEAEAIAAVLLSGIGAVCAIVLVLTAALVLWANR